MDVPRKHRKYGYTETGQLIEPPRPDRYGRNAGIKWTILPEGAPVPQVHCEYISFRDVNTWASPRRCHSTMTPWVAGVCGHVQAYAVPGEGYVT